MKKKFIVDDFNKLEIFDIDINHLRSKHFYKNALINRDFYYKKYNKYLNTKSNIYKFFSVHKSSHLSY